MRGLRQLVIVLGLVLTGSFGAAQAAQHQLPVEILPADGEYDGVSMGEWDARSIQQGLSFPEGMSPSLDTTGEMCGYGQFGPVFLLPRNAMDSRDVVVTMKCTVPEGFAIYYAWSAFDCNTLEHPEMIGASEEEFAACAKEAQDWLTTVIISINGVPVENPLQYRHSSPLTTFMIPPHSWTGSEPGIGQAVFNGYSFIIAPPEPGQYVIDLQFVYASSGQVGHEKYIIDVVAPVGNDSAATPEGN